MTDAFECRSQWAKCLPFGKRGPTVKRMAPVITWFTRVDATTHHSWTVRPLVHVKRPVRRSKR